MNNGMWQCLPCLSIDYAGSICLLRRQGQAEKEGNYEKQTLHSAKIRLSESKSKEKSEKLFIALPSGSI